MTCLLWAGPAPGGIRRGQWAETRDTFLLCQPTPIELSIQERVAVIVDEVLKSSKG
jgi:hypothetical protein